MKKVDEVAKVLNVTRGTVYKWIKEGRIMSVKLRTDKRAYIRIPDEEFNRIQKEGI